MTLAHYLEKGIPFQITLLTNEEMPYFHAPNNKHVDDDYEKF
jgi:hypothetical protein